MSNKNLKIGAAILLVSGAGLAQAQGIRPAYTFPGTTPSGAVQLGTSPVFFTPYAGFGVGYDDNVILSNSGQTSSTVYITSLGFKLDARGEASAFQVNYQGQLAKYSDSESDNYIDHTVRSQFDTAFSGRSFLRLGYDFIRSHDPRGSNDRPLSAEPDKYQLSEPRIMYAFGAPGSQGRVEAYASEARLKYRNNREITAATDRKKFEFGGAFYWRVMPKTYLLAEARKTNISYVIPSPVSGDEMRYYGGVSWEATAATTGTIKVGRLTRRFNGDIPESNDTSWEALVSWAPRTYSRFDFYSSRQTIESTGVGTFLLSTASGVNWSHSWNSVLSTAILVRYQRDEFQGTERTDETTSLGLRAGYKMRRWLTLGAEYNYTKRDTNQPGADYDKNMYLLTATASM